MIAVIPKERTWKASCSGKSFQTRVFLALCKVIIIENARSYSALKSFGVGASFLFVYLVFFHLIFYCGWDLWAGSKNGLWNFLWVTVRYMAVPKPISEYTAEFHVEYIEESMKYNSRFWRLSPSQGGEIESVFLKAESKLSPLLSGICMFLKT